MPQERKDAHLRAEYYIVLSYYLGGKNRDAVEYFEESGLPMVANDFPAFQELVTILYDLYQKLGQCEKAEGVLGIIEKGDADTARHLKLYSAVSSGYISEAVSFAQDDEAKDDVEDFASDFCRCSKSVRGAQILNAVLPGAGYYYVGQKNSAITSLIINTLTTAAAIHFFERGNWGAGFFTASLEMGWYFGGINGAGLAAKEYNQHLYRDRGKELMIRRKFFPVLMLQTSF
jgi:hypothetical protein